MTADANLAIGRYTVNKPQSSSMPSLRIPHLRKSKTSSQLMVNGKPFLMLAAELHYSSLSDPAYMQTVWQNTKDMSINTLLGSVTWEMIEPVEGQFNFAEADQVILDARRYNKHLVLLWLGSFKNALSTYVPGWVKKDVKRFPRVHVSEAGAVTRTLELVSPFNDRKATWEEAFGSRDMTYADEMFMAHAYSSYVGRVAAAGKKEHPIPFYTNVWFNFDDPTQLDLQGLPPIVGGGAKAGVYPSGSAVPHTMDVWKFNTPALDFISPDLYFHNYESVCKHYTHQGQPLFILEQRRDEKRARRVWLAYGSYAAMGCSLFGIDSELAKDAAVTQHYGLLRSISKILLEKQAESPEDIMGFYFDEVDETITERKWVKTFGDFQVTIDRSFVFGKPGTGAGMVIHQGDGKFLLVGWGFQVTFKSTKPQSMFTGILYSKEKTIDKEDKLRTARVMNGDETRSGSFYIMPNEEPDYGGFPIAVTIGSRTMIAECTAFSIEEEAEDF
jgi:hypothetical protein